MTPAIDFLTSHKLAFKVHEYEVQVSSGQYGSDAAAALGVAPERVFKTLLVCLNNQSRNLAVCIIPVNRELNLKQAARAHNARKAQMADPALAENMTGYKVGGISPFGQKRTLLTAIDVSALHFDSIYTSGGRRNLEVEFAPQDLIRVLHVVTAPLSR